MSWLKRSVAAVKRNDPAARTTLEVLLTYPGLHA
ncbi:serine O-acetyltransferase, partial [Listeria monocytogenes]|nr:serine O-acetyltransferase [Listeria monocytogenes]